AARSRSPWASLWRSDSSSAAIRRAGRPPCDQSRLFAMNRDGTPMSDQLDLDEDPFDDDLQRRLAATAPRRIANRTTVILAGAVLAIGGVLARGPGAEELGRPPAPHHPHPPGG